MTRRILAHPILGKIEDHHYVSFTFNHKIYQGLGNESLAAALLANGVRTLRHHEESGSPRGFYCNIGHCYECRVTVDGQKGFRACLTPIKEGMVVESSGQLQPSRKEDGGLENG
ncbi:(2Fe-2S)-binding protein [Bacillus haynesii]|uniref:Sarcosine oxidase subunit alpha n=1 Tax=Bacillus haynesii TaxID=1925021 RepID=A0ABX3I0K0_9BACI|nr:(2Fe-2S)-binding protein [Bacillus haynesii]EWH21093.1 (2Fe-2S)-binding protein [Bacillus haynesii]MCI4126832.1 (2Fe-2S)-binding protein [Bacillus haynesii]OMI25394.1 sarcosine oxidase subunit alpha [Bacillus haynesii]